MSWEDFIAWIALIFSVVCFVMFVLDAIGKPKPEDVAEQVSTRMASAAANPAFDPRILGALAKALAEALSKVGPGLVALIGAILFLLLAGEAANVYNLTGSVAEGEAAAGEDGEGNSVDEPSNGSDDANRSDNAADLNDDANAAANAT